MREGDNRMRLWMARDNDQFGEVTIFKIKPIKRYYTDNSKRFYWDKKSEDLHSGLIYLKSNPLKLKKKECIKVKVERIKK